MFLYLHFYWLYWHLEYELLYVDFFSHFRLLYFLIFNCLKLDYTGLNSGTGLWRYGSLLLDLCYLNKCTIFSIYLGTISLIIPPSHLSNCIFFTSKFYEHFKKKKNKRVSNYILPIWLVVSRPGEPVRHLWHTDTLTEMLLARNAPASRSMLRYAALMIFDQSPFRYVSMVILDLVGR